MNITTKLQYGYYYIVYYIKFCLLIQYIIEHPPLVIAVPVETKGLGVLYLIQRTGNAAIIPK